MRSWKPAAARKNYEREEWSRYAKQFNVLYSGKPSQCGVTCRLPETTVQVLHVSRVRPTI
jgi:hypothetical protein